MKGNFTVRFFRKEKNMYKQLGVHTFINSTYSYVLSNAVMSARTAMLKYGRVSVVIKKDDKRYNEGERTIFKESFAA